MKAIDYNSVDKSSWQRGPWDDEYDKRQWLDEATGLPCMIIRNRDMGFWCGYVGVSRGHPSYERHYDDVAVDVHGGLTFSNRCLEGDESHAICHVVEPGEDDDVWWLGFDCGHYLDFAPGMPRLLGLCDGVYKNQQYAINECTQLAAQLAGMTR